MTRAQLEHLIRASATIADDDEIMIVGSQAILGEHPSAPDELLRSNEADVYPRNKPDRSDLIDGSIGEGSPFHDTFGYYAQGVGVVTAILPVGWETRLCAIRNANTRGATGWCLETHDLVLSKLVAGRDKDVAFLEGAARAGLVTEGTLLERLPTMAVHEAVREQARHRILRAFRAS